MVGSQTATIAGWPFRVASRPRRSAGPTWSGGTDSDIKNSPGKRDAHCIVGGMFLKEFVNDGVPWAHIDIASVATSDSGQITGATGFGVRLMVDYLKRHSA